MVRARHRVRAEIEIDAPIERVWQVLKHVDRYGAWNPFTPRVETTFRIGDPIHLSTGREDAGSGRQDA